MQTELLSISKIFTENLFRIPDYQRGYSWAGKQLKDFWNDIDQLEEGKNHYTGVLTLEEVPAGMFKLWNDDLWIIEAKHYTPYYVVDGQQRLTTIVILLQVILEVMSESQALNYSTKKEIRKKFIFESKDAGISRSYLFGYEKDNPSYEFLKTVIFNERSDSHSTSEETIYTHNLSHAKEFFFERIKHLDHKSLERVYARVTQNLLFNIYTITDDIDVFVAFETMNNRGKPLSHLELLKNRLIFLSTKFTVDKFEKKKLRDVINECWKTAYHYLGKNKARPLSDDHFLETHFFVHFGPQLTEPGEEAQTGSLWKYSHEDYYKEYLLEELFTARRLAGTEESLLPNLSVDSLYAYAQDLKSAVKLYYSLFNPSQANFTSSERIHLERLRRLGIQQFSIFLVALFMKEQDPNLREQILELLERLKFLQTISHYIPELENLDFRFLGVEVLAGRKTSQEIKAIITRHLTESIKKVQFVTVFANLGKGYYAWRGLKYFLFEYEQELLSNSKTKREKLIWETFAREKFEDDYETVEHIYPQRVLDDCWRRPFAEYSVKQRNVLKNSLGNLIPLSRPKNSSLRNKCFADKKGSESNKVGYMYGCYSEIEVAQSSDWTPREILIRGTRLLEFMGRRWEFPLGSTEDKIKALRLQFVVKNLVKLD